MTPPHLTDIKYVKGIGPAKAKLLAEQINVRTVDDLLHYFPSHYVDRQRIYSLNNLGSDMAMVQVKGRFVSFSTLGEGAKSRLVALFTDGTATMEVVWFRRIKAIKETYHTATEYILFGKPQLFNGRWSMVHPEIDTQGAPGALQGLRGVYPLTEKLRNNGITSRNIFTWVQNALAISGHIEETLPSEVIQKYHFVDADSAFRTVHNPPDPASLTRARERLKFEELFFIQLNLRRYAQARKTRFQGFVFSKIGSFFNNFYSRMLPFPLTDAQKRVLREIRTDVGSGKQMNRLLQGDVGSGKTIVALMTMLMAIDNGKQAAIMAPTEILARQHYDTMRQMAAPIGINVRLLTGSTRKKERDELMTSLAAGEVHILVGTHALIEDPVVFHDLGLVIIDEQHRFGVMQRAKLWTKNNRPPHVLVMTATPIPRTLAMTVYGDLDVSVIDQLPPGRKPVTTLLRYEEQRQQMMRVIGRELQKGRQAYIVYPLIEENDKLELKSLQEGYDFICDTFPSYRVVFVHGKMKPTEKDHQMQLFVEGKAQIMVATTVIEVGVNVPNASVMLIENAERFGLSQLHQLRGRVGRGADQSFCILMSKVKIAATTRQRLELMTKTTDGFVIAEADMKMRGPGDIEGTLQSGMPFELKIANLASDGQCVQAARNCVDALLESDPELTKPEHRHLVAILNRLFPRKIVLSKIS